MNDINMENHISKYKDLIGVLLGPVRERPGLYIGEAKISKLLNFITGYSIGVHMTKDPQEPMDRYFVNPGFVDWFFNKYNIESPTFERPFLEQANGDEKLALELFFKYLEEYSKVIAANKDVGTKASS